MARINDNGIDRDMTAEELTAHEIWSEQARRDEADAEAAAQAAAAARVSAKAKLAALGLTNEEINALVGA